MALLFNLIYSKNPLRKEELKNIYLILKNLTMMNVYLMKLDEVTRCIIRCTGHPADTRRSVLNRWNKKTIELRPHGYAVELGYAGYIKAERTNVRNMVRNIYSKDFIDERKRLMKLSHKARYHPRLYPVIAGNILMRIKHPPVIVG